MCSKHFPDITKLLAGAHVTINATTEDDVEESRIVKKLSANTSAYNFKSLAKDREIHGNYLHQFSIINSVINSICVSLFSL